MSAPTPAGGDDSPQPGYYPDPSIPGYVRYWNGAAWVPGTSRPAPKAGEAMPAVPGGTARQNPPGTAESAAPAALEETGPVFIDEEPDERIAPSEPATAWQADTSRQSGFGGERDHRVSWGGGREPSAQGPSGPVPAPQIPDSRAEHGTSAPPERAPAPQGPVQVPESRSPARAADPRLPAQGGDPTGGALPGARSVRPSPAGPPADRTVTIRPTRSRPGDEDRSGERPPGERRPPADGTLTIRAQPGQGGEAPGVRSMPPGAAAPPQPQPSVPPRQQPQPQPHMSPQAPVPPHAHVQPQAQHVQPQPHAQPNAQPQPLPHAHPQPQPHAQPQGGPQQAADGAASWAQQVHRLARPDEAEQQPVVPWKPPVDDPFLQIAQAQAAARPAALGRRFAARLIDTVVLGALVAAVAVPVAGRTLAHVDDKIEAARHSGRTVTVWLLDGTTAVHLGIVLGALLLLGALYEALPTARWGRTLGKRLCGLRVVDIESHEPPPLGAALRRWLVYGVLGLAVVGVLNVLWGLFDRPWRQCWHDKAAHTFVTAG
ncbi:RDD family protein [Streptomyces sp. NPDC014894]|uniref:RDD family protein n=1 Tax=Streptomyces sp. NPDC014894 TaxID=3364931 RepID=UPI0036F84BB3